MNSKVWNIRNLFIISLIVYFISQLYTFFYGIRTLSGDGFGNDGATYAGWVINNLSLLDYYQTLSAYHIQRVLPGIIVHYALMFLNFDLLNRDTLIKAFLLLDNIMITATILGLFSLARYLKWTLEATFIAFITLVFNFLILKQMYHYTILTDYTAFALGFFQIYFYIKNKNICLYLTSLIGAFVWPTLLLTGLLMLIFQPDMFQNKAPNPTITFFKNTKSWKILTLTFLISLIATVILKIEQPKMDVYWLRYIHADQIHKLNFYFMLPSLFIMVTYFVYIVYPFLLVFCQNVFVRENFNKKLLLNIVIAIFTFLTINTLIHSLSNAAIPDPATIGSFLLRPIYPVLFPGFFFIAYIPFFGIGTLLFIYLYTKMDFNPISSIAAVSTLLLLVFFILEPEPRQAINFIPLISVLLGTYLSQQRISVSFCFYYAILAYLFSRAWLPNFYPYSPVPTYPHTGILSIPIGMVLLYILLKREGLNER